MKNKNIDDVIKITNLINERIDDIASRFDRLEKYLGITREESHMAIGNFFGDYMIYDLYKGKKNTGFIPRTLDKLELISKELGKEFYISKPREPELKLRKIKAENNAKN